MIKLGKSNERRETSSPSELNSIGRDNT